MLIDWFTTIAQVINFLILVWLLKHFLYKPILNAVSARETQITEKILNAEKLQTDAQATREDLNNKIKNIDDQQTDLMNKATADAETERKRLLIKARKETDELREKGRENLKREEKNVHQTIIKRIQKEVFSLTRKVLLDLTDSTLESQMVDVFIRKFDELSKENKDLMKSGASSHGIVRSNVELTSNQRVAIERIILEKFDEKINLKFEVERDLCSGIEFISNGQKIAWSIDDYLDVLEKEVSQLQNPEKSSS